MAFKKAAALLSVLAAILFIARIAASRPPQAPSAAYPRLPISFAWVPTVWTARTGAALCSGRAPSERGRLLLEISQAEIKGTEGARWELARQ
jgi:hypothetical protein